MAKRRRKGADRLRLEHLQSVTGHLKFLDPEYELIPDNPASRQPERERARRAIKALFPEGVPDAATLSNKRLAKKVNEWLELNKEEPVQQRTIQRAAGRP